MSHCEVVEMRNSADAVGYLCSRTASTQCSDCGSELCEAHAETCGGCHAVFCPSCLTFHQEQHPKPASADREQNRQARLSFSALQSSGRNLIIVGARLGLIFAPGTRSRKFP